MGRQRVRRLSWGRETVGGRALWIGLCCAGLAPLWPPASAEAGSWPHERAIGGFVVRAEFALERVAPMLEELPELQEQVRASLRLAPRHEPIHVYLFSSRQSLHRYMARHFPHFPRRPALFVKQRGPGMVFASYGPSLHRDLRHEVTHAVLHAHLPLVPLWLDEGVAEYFEVPLQADGPPDPRHASVPASVRTLRSLQRLEQLHSLEQMGHSEYLQAWAWVHFLLHGDPAARDALTEYVRDLQRQQVPQPISVALAGIPALEARLARHWQHR